MLETSSNETLIFGVDVEPGSSKRSKNEAKYSVAILCSKGFVAEYTNVPFTRLIRLIWENKPAVVAVDNVFELARDMDELYGLMKIVPQETKIVQVTGWGRDTKDLRVLAKEHGISIPEGKLNPLDTAKVAAKLASMNVGSVVKPVLDRVKVIVTKGRTVSQGGMSQDRFKRSIRAGILSVTKEIKNILDNNRIDYDLVIRRSSGGLEKSVFIVYSSLDKVKSLIKPLKTRNVRLIIKPYLKPFETELTLTTLHTTKGLILGVDPGTTVGLALIDLDGKPVLVHSSKNIDRYDILETVSRIGKVVVVATDVKETPEIVKKIASALNAIIYSPNEDLSVEEKENIVYRLVKKYPYIEVKDTHSRDALAAAYKAYLHFLDKLRNIDSKLKSIDLDIDREKIRIEVLKGRDFADALEEELINFINRFKNRAEPSRHDKQIIIDEKRFMDKIIELKSRISYLESQINSLRKEIEERDRVIDELQLELKSIRLSTPIDVTDRKLYSLKQEVDQLKKTILEKECLINELRNLISRYEEFLKQIVSGEIIVVPRLGNLCLSNLKNIFNNWVNVKYLYVEEVLPLDIDAFSLAKSKGVAILTPRDYGELYREVRVPVIKVQPIAVFNNVVLIDKSVEKTVENMWRTIHELDYMDEYDKIVRLIKKYQEERRKTTR